MSKSIKAMKKDFKANAGLELRNEKLQDEVTALNATVSLLLKKIDQMMELDVEGDGILEKGYTNEQEIIEVQIARLQAISRTKTLSLDDTRALDILLKNKRLIDKKAAEDLVAEWADMTPEELIGIAEDVTEDEQVEESKASQAEASEKGTLA